MTSPNSPTTVLEIVHFKLHENASDAQLADTHPAIDTFLHQQPGFLYRSLSQQDCGEYIDIVYWESLEAAKAASDALMENDAGKAMLALIDMDSVVMQHLPVLAESMSEPATEHAAMA